MAFKRGQAGWGAMEIVIAVIIMAVSMSLIFFIMKQADETHCVAELRAKSTDLQNALLDVALGSPPTTRTVAYEFPSCKDADIEALRFVYYKTPNLCRRCPGQYNGCWMIEPTAYDAGSNKFYTMTEASVCVNMPADITLEPKDDGSLNCKLDNIQDKPCPKNNPIKPNTPISCTEAVHGVPSTVYSTTTASSNSLWVTFGRKPGDPRTFFFKLTKSADASHSGIINICPKTVPG